MIKCKLELIPKGMRSKEKLPLHDFLEKEKKNQFSCLIDFEHEDTKRKEYLVLYVPSKEDIWSLGFKYGEFISQKNLVAHHYALRNIVNLAESFINTEDDKMNEKAKDYIKKIIKDAKVPEAAIK